MLRTNSFVLRRHRPYEGVDDLMHHDGGNLNRIVNVRHDKQAVVVDRTVEITALCLVRSASSKRLASVRPVRCNSLGSSTLKLGHPWKLESNAPEPLEERIGARAA